MVVADADEHAGFPGGGFEPVQFGHADPGGFFDENMFAVFHRLQGDGCECGIERGNEDNFHLRIGYGWFEIGNGAAGFGELHQFLGARQIRVAGNKRACEPAGSPARRFFPINPQPMMA